MILGETDDIVVQILFRLSLLSGLETFAQSIATIRSSVSTLPLEASLQVDSDVLVKIEDRVDHVLDANDLWRHWNCELGSIVASVKEIVVV